MQDIKSVHIVYFSGTGSTARVADYLKKAFGGHEIAITETQLNTKSYTEQNADLLVILYPVYAFNAPMPIDEWIAQAPAGEGRTAAVFSVSGGGEVSPNTACRTGVIRQLEGKGYDVCYESMFVMPSNVFITLNDVLCAMLLKASQNKAERVATDILSGRTVRTKPYAIDLQMSKLGLIEKRSGGVSFAKKLKATEQCSGCSWCVIHCPRGNITMQDGKPVFGKQCIVCLRCVYGCPQKAIVPGAGKLVVLKKGYDFKDIEKRSRTQTEFPPAADIAKGYVLNGIKKYLEENLGQTDRSNAKV